MNAKEEGSDFTSEFQERTRKLMGERIRQLWVSSGEQQDDFVKELGVSTVTLSNYMSGKRKPDSEFLFAFKNKLNIHLDWLLTGEGPMRPGEAAVEATPEPRAAPPDAAEGPRCPTCAKLEAELEAERTERRELSAENRQLWKDNARLREENATMRERAISHGSNNMLGSAG